MFVGCLRYEVVVRVENLLHHIYITYVQMYNELTISSLDTPSEKDQKRLGSNIYHINRGDRLVSSSSCESYLGMCVKEKAYFVFFL